MYNYKRPLTQEEKAISELGWNNFKAPVIVSTREQVRAESIENFLRMKRMMSSSDGAFGVRDSYRTKNARSQSALSQKALLSSAFGVSSSSGLQSQDGSGDIQFDTNFEVEMRLVKTIVSRERYVFNLIALDSKVRKQKTLKGFQSLILESLSQIKESTLDYVEQLSLWRRSKVRQPLETNK
jgi:hypothetical protein